MKNVLNQSLCIELHTNVVFFIRYHTIIWFTTVSEFAFYKNGYLTEKKVSILFLIEYKRKKVLSTFKNRIEI